MQRMDDPAHTKIVLRDVEVSVRVGLESWERERPQRLLVNVELYAESSDYLWCVTPNSIIDYRKIYDRIQSWRVGAHTDLIETPVSDLLAAGFDYRDVIACRVSVVKPDVLDQAQAAGAEAFMTRRDYERSRAGQLVRARSMQRP